MGQRSTWSTAAAEITYAIAAATRARSTLAPTIFRQLRETRNNVGRVLPSDDIPPSGVYYRQPFRRRRVASGSRVERVSESRRLGRKREVMPEEISRCRRGNYEETGKASAHEPESSQELCSTITPNHRENAAPRGDPLNKVYVLCLGSGPELVQDTHVNEGRERSSSHRFGSNSAYS